LKPQPNFTNQRPIDETVFHGEPHADEYLADVFSHRFGGEHFEFAKNHKYGYIMSSTEGNLSTLHPTKLFLGVGGGQFDDHGTNSEKSCCQLVAEFLGIQDRPAIINVLKAVTSNDKNGGQTKHSSTISRVINYAHRQGVHPDTVRAWAAKIFNAIIDSEERLLENVKYRYRNIRDEPERQRKVRKDFLNVKRPWHYLTVPACASLLNKCDAVEWVAFADKIVAENQRRFEKARDVASDYIADVDTTDFGRIRLMIMDGSPQEGEEEGPFFGFETQLDPASRHHQVDVVFIRNSLGHNFIAVNRSFQGNLKPFVKAVRKAEADRRGIELSEDQLVAQGAILELQIWYVHEMQEEQDQYRRVYNGTTTRKWIENSILTFEEIQEILIKSLGVTAIAEAA
jgi:hypothetical protein